MGSFTKFSENKLPDKCEFFSSLKDKCISEKDYQRANNAWNTFKMNSMSDCHNLYLKGLLKRLLKHVWIIMDYILVIILVVLVMLGCYVKNDRNRIRIHFRY